MYKLLSFDVYGTLINTPPINVKAFRRILEQAGASNIDALTFYQFWESRNIVHYREPYRSYREIGELSLEESFENFGVVGGTADLIERYFELFPEMQLYPDVLPTLERLAGRYRLAVVSNIDDDLLGATRLGRGFDLVCTAERAVIVVRLPTIDVDGRAADDRIRRHAPFNRRRVDERLECRTCLAIRLPGVINYP